MTIWVESADGSVAPARLVRESPACATIPPGSISDASISMSNSTVSVLSVRSNITGPAIMGLTLSITICFANESESRVPGRGRFKSAARSDHSTVPPLSEDADTYPRSAETSPSRTIYSKTSSSVPEPDAYEASLSTAPVSSRKSGVPATATGSENLTAKSISSPMTYVPSGSSDPTLVTTAGRNCENRYAAPLSSFISSSCDGEPAAHSGAPSPSKSPNMAIDSPNVSVDAPSAAPSETACLAEPSLFIKSIQPPPAPGAPTAMSGIPSPSTSPAPDIDAPNLSLSDSAGPPPAVSPILWADKTPALSINSTCIAPLESEPRPSSPGAPTAMSGTPLPSMSPTPATELPSMSPASTFNAWSRGTLIASYEGPRAP